MSGKRSRVGSINKQKSAEMVKTIKKGDVWEAKSCRRERICKEKRCLGSKVVSDRGWYLREHCVKGV